MASAEEVVQGRVEFHDLVGPLNPEDGPLAKGWRVLSYYGRLLAFAARTDAPLFHVLWFRKFLLLEGVLLTAYFKLLGKKVVFTAHNVDQQARDGRSGTLRNRLALVFLYRVLDQILVHTPQMKAELTRRFGVPAGKVDIVPLGINDVIPVAEVTRREARRELGLRADERVLLFFGNIAPYKGVEDVLRALATLVREGDRFTLVLGGAVKDKGCQAYWEELESLIERHQLRDYVRKEVRWIPDREVGFFFKAADVAVLPYRRVYQSGVVALSYAQGVPVIASDAGSLMGDVVEGKTGFVFRSGDVEDLARTIRKFFASDLFHDLEARSEKIRAYGAEAYSWGRNGDVTCAAYERLLEH
jgi:glycosyltransferase involved in cell wall biosynthesis